MTEYTLPTVYQEFIALSRYARYDPELGRRERWPETVQRLIDFWRGRFPKLGDEVFSRLHEAILHLRVMPSMRSLMTAGPAATRDEVALYNCSTAAVTGTGPEVSLWDSKLEELGFDEPIKLQLRTPIVFDELLYVLLCFHPDTLVETRGGPKRIADIEIGDMVYSYNEESKKSVWREVTSTVVTPSANKPKVRVTLDTGVSFDCTADHKWLTSNRGWVEAQDLTAEDDLVHPTYEHIGSSAMRVQSVEFIQDDVDYVDITVEGSHNFQLYQGPIVHNCGTGAGFSVERQFISEMPTVGKPLARSIYKKTKANYPGVAKDELSSFDKRANTIQVADSKYGWASALRILIVELYNGNFDVKHDTSQVRPSGSVLKTFGGRASGPSALVKMFEEVREVFRAADGRKLTSIEAHDVMCYVADAVVVGGVEL